MRRMRDWLLTGIAAVLCAVLLSGCGPAEQKETAIVEEQPEEEAGYETWLQRYTIRSAEITLSDRREGVLFQQDCDGGFLAYINRKVREEIPSELKENPEFVNDGRYDVYESALFTVTQNGKRHKIRRYRTLPAPENTEQLERYFSETRPRAFRMRPDGSIVETVELADHPFFVGVQFHPEFKSRPNRPHPLFCGLIDAALRR